MDDVPSTERNFDDSQAASPMQPHEHHQVAAGTAGTGARSHVSPAGSFGSPHQHDNGPSIQDELHDLSTFQFPRPTDPEEDPTGRSAFSAVSEQFDAATRQQFMRFPSNSVLERLECVDKVRLSHCGLGDKGAVALVAALRVNHTITDLDLVDNGLSYQGLKTLLSGLPKNIKVLDLGSNRICKGCVISLSKDMPSVMAQQQGMIATVGGGAAGSPSHSAGAAAAAAGQSPPSTAASGTAAAAAPAAAAAAPLPAASVNTMTFFTGVAQTGSAGYALSQMLQKNSTLTSLGLSNTKLNDTDCAALAEGLSENAALLSLDLSNNDLGAGSAAALATILMRSELREINLEWNRLQNTGAVLMIKEGLPVTTVKRLLLGWNGLGDEAAEQLGKVLAGSSPLEEVDLKHNHIGAKGAEYIAKGVRSCMALTTLIINNNPLRDDGCVALLRAIQENQTLFSVDMRETGAGDAATSMLPSVLNGKSEKFEIDMPRSAAAIEEFE